MLRSLLAPRGSLASFSLRRHATPPLNTTTLIQHVRIKQRRRIRNVAIGAGVVYICWSVYIAQVIAPPMSQQFEDEGSPIFFPVPFSFRMVESRPYKGTDPEWQEYIRIARDQELLVRIRNQLLEIVHKAAETNPVLIRKCGPKMRVRNHWLDLDFPYRPPPKVLRDGFLLYPDRLELVTVESDQMTMMRVLRALWPVPVAKAASSFVSTLFKQNVQSVSRFFGLETADPHASMNSLASVVKRKMDEAERGSTADGKPKVRRPADTNNNSKDPGAIPATGSVNTSGLPADISSVPGSRPLSSSSSSPSPVPSSSDRDRDLGRTITAKDWIPFDTVRSSIDGARVEFNKKLSETWLPLRPHPPGGCVGVSGMVELQAPNSRITIEVRAFWDPKTRKYDLQTMHMKLRSIRPKYQSPL